MTAWRYTRAPTQELRWYPAGTKVLPGIPLLAEFDDMALRGGPDQSAAISHIERHGAIASDHLLPLNSGDSWGAFYRRNSLGFGPQWNYGRYEPEHAYLQRKGERKTEHPASIEQRAFEDARNARRRLQQKASDEEWAAAERKVQEAAARRREAAARRLRAAEEVRRHREIAEAQFYAQERADWVRTLQEAITLCEGTPYAPLIPQMRADIANIEAQPPGALPWRFDRAAFHHHFASFKAQIDAGTYRRV